MPRNVRMVKPNFMRAIFLLITLFFSNNTDAQREYFTIKNYNITLNVQPDGIVDVREEIMVHFDTLRRGIFRRIPIRYQTDQGNLKFKLSQIQVDGWDYIVYDEGNDKVIRIGEEDVFIDGQQQYVISYRAKNSFLWHEDRPEIYWNLVGTGWPVDIEKIEYEVFFPEDLDIDPGDYQIFTGTEGAEEVSASLQKRGNRIFGSSTRAF
ncbi:MAG: DUF2207 domain-containing protein, partial [Melioribacteraceae bacterium]|nr:DUF2207 domain-containing protein [Melioribacteraceae bacterium]